MKEINSLKRVDINSNLNAKKENQYSHKLIVV